MENELANQLLSNMENLHYALKSYFKSITEAEKIKNAIALIPLIGITVSSDLVLQESIKAELDDYFNELNAMDAEFWESQKLENSLEDEINFILSEIEDSSNRITDLREIQEKILKIQSTWKDFEIKSKKQHKEGLEELPHIFQKHQTAIPINLDKVIYWKLSEKNLGELTLGTIPEMLKNISVDNQDLFQWAEEYSKTFEKTLMIVAL